MSNMKIEYGTSAALTITLASLAANSTTGVESDQIDNSTNKYLDYLFAGKITTGTSPTVSTNILVYLVGMQDDSTWPEGFDGTGSAETVTSLNTFANAGKLAAVITVDATSDRTYYFGPCSVAQLFGGAVPKKFVAFVLNNTAQNLNATGGNHALFVTPVYATV